METTMLLFKDLTEKQFWKDLILQGNSPEVADAFVRMMRARQAPERLPANREFPLRDAEGWANQGRKIDAIKAYREGCAIGGLYPTLKEAKDCVEHYMDHKYWPQESMDLADKVREYWWQYQASRE